MNKDTVVGILGAVILVAAMVAIFYYEGTQVPGGTGGAGGTGGGAGGNALYRTSTAAGPTASGQNTEEVTVDITQANVTAINFTLTWTDDVAQSDPDTFRVTVTGPTGTTYEGTAEGSDGGEGVVVRISPINSVPAAANAAPATLGQGTWTVSVELVGAGQVGGAPAPPVPIPGVTDTGNAWDLATDVETFQRA